MSNKKPKYEVSAAKSKDCYDRIIVARTTMVMTCPFFGVLAAQLKLVENNTWCRTLAVDCKHLYYNAEFITGIENPALRQEYEDKLRDAIDSISEEQIKNSLD